MRFRFRDVVAASFLAVLGAAVGCGGPIAQQREEARRAAEAQAAAEERHRAVGESAEQAARHPTATSPDGLPTDGIAPGPGAIADPNAPAPTPGVKGDPKPTSKGGDPNAVADARAAYSMLRSSTPGRTAALKSAPGRDGGVAGGGEGKVGQVQPANPNQPAANGDPYDRQQVEAYNHYRENEFRSPLTAPLSTFSADVNTASYSNVRRYLNSGRLPPKDAVFLAEFVNYFEYDYPKAKGADPIAYAIELGPCPWNRQHHLVRVGVQARTIDPAEMPVRNLVFLIDTSGSMSGPTRLPLVKQSLALLIDRLTDKDRVSIVTYAGDASLRLEPTPGSQKAAIKSAVDSLNAGGGTNGGGGIKMAYEQARRSFVEGGVNRVVLCTDGDFNIGQTSDAEMVRMIEQERRSGVFLTVLGYGMGNVKDSKLHELANNGNGHYAYIDTIDEAKKVFVEQGGALVTVAKDVKFQVEFNPKRVTAYRLVGYENRLLKDEDFKNDAKDAGDMGSGHQVTVLYEVVPAGVTIDLPGVDPLKYQQTAPAATAADEWLTVKMRYKHPDAETSRELSRSLTGDATAKGKELSDDFRWAAATASFGMLLRDSRFKGGMTYAGVLEEAQGAVGKDSNGRRKGFLDVVKKAKELAAGGKPAEGGVTGSN